VLRVATWNMDHWRRSEILREQAWDFLHRVARIDVALVQEAVPVGRGRSVVFRETGIRDDRVQPSRDLQWGSAVVSYGPQLRPIEQVTGPFSSTPIDLLRTFPGSVAIAEIELESPIVVVSAYGIIDHGYAESTVHRILSDLTPLIDERRSRRIIVAGDLNVTTQWSAKHKSFLRGRHEECLLRDRNLFARFEALGLHNVVVREKSGPLEGCECSSGIECKHVQTQRHDRSIFPWQNDYIFLSEDLLQQPFTVEVLDQDDVWKFSSHCPVVVEFK
jgi:hypothetical protein